MTNTTPHFIGIDISKDTLEVAFAAGRNTQTFANNEDGLVDLITALGAYPAPLVVMEASGGWERALLMALQSASVASAIINPTRIRSFARAMGQIAKNDPIDAEVIREFGDTIKPQPTPLNNAAAQALRDLIVRRRQLVDMRSKEKNRCHTAAPQQLTSIKRHIAWLDEEIAALETEIDVLLGTLPGKQSLANLLQTAPAVGPITAKTLCAILPELGQVNRRKIAALAGLAPYDRDTGRRRGKRTIFGGRAEVRSVLYMAVLTGKHTNPALCQMYDRLLAKGKPKKLAMTACMRKLLTILNAMARDNQPWVAPA